jgi:hypothetical protein
VLNDVACRPCATGIDGRLADINVLDDSIFVDYECGAIGETFGVIQYAIILGNVSHEIAEKGKFDPDLLCEGFVGGRTVNAYT